MNAWKHGHYVDLWSFVHFLSGMLLCIGFAWVGFTLLPALLLTLVLLFVWEMYEWLLKILETPTNVSLDILIGVLGFFFAAYWHYFLGNSFDTVAVFLLIALTLLLSAWGFSDLFTRGYR